MLIRRSTGFAVSLALLLACGTASATERPRIDQDTYTSAISLASGHPNERARWHGLWAYSNGRDKAAREYFERAAFYGDKPSQYLLSVMAWAGEGAARDPVEAYIWADLAAERGKHEKLLGIREYIWSTLTEDERARVAKQGPEFYARYGDAVALPRTNAQIARFSRSRTGSRAGGDTGRMNLNFGAGKASNWMSCPSKNSTSSEFAMSQNDVYDRARTDPKFYWTQQDLVLRSILTGTGTASDLREVELTPGSERPAAASAGS